MLEFHRIIEIVHRAISDDVAFVIYLPHEDLPEGMLLSTRPIKPEEKVMLLIKHEEYWVETHLLEAWWDWDPEHMFDLEEYGGASVLFPAVLLNPKSAFVEPGVTVERLTELYLCVYRNENASESRGGYPGKAARVVQRNTRYYECKIANGKKVDIESVTQLASRLLPDEEELRNALKKVIDKANVWLSRDYELESATSEKVESFDRIEAMISCAVEEALRKTPTLIPKVRRSNFKSEGIIDRLFASANNRLRQIVQEAVTAILKANGYSLVVQEMKQPEERNIEISQRTTEPDESMNHKDGKESRLGKDREGVVLGGKEAPLGGTSVPKSPRWRERIMALVHSNEGSLDEEISEEKKTNEGLEETVIGNDHAKPENMEANKATKKETVVDFAPSEVLASEFNIEFPGNITGGNPTRFSEDDNSFHSAKQNPADSKKSVLEEIKKISKVRTSTAPLKRISRKKVLLNVEDDAKLQLPELRVEGLVSLVDDAVEVLTKEEDFWRPLDTDLVSWIVRAETADGHLKDLVKFFRGKHSINIQDLANFICVRKPITGKIAKLQLSDEEIESEEKFATSLVQRYRCGRSAILRWSPASAALFYGVIISVVATSAVISVFSQDSGWARAESFFNLLFTGAVAVVLALMSLDLGGRVIAVDAALASIAMDNLPRTKKERRAALKALCESDSPALYVDGPISWMPEECQGYTRINDAVPLDEICERGYLRVTAGKMVARICKQDRVMRMSEEGNTLLAGEREVKKRFWQAIIRVTNRVERVTPMRSSGDEMKILVMDSDSKTAKSMALRPMGSADNLFSRSSNVKTRNRNMVR